MTIFSSIFFVYKHFTKSEIDSEYYHIYFIMALTPSIAILFLLVIASAIATTSAAATAQQPVSLQTHKWGCGFANKVPCLPIWML